MTLRGQNKTSSENLLTHEEAMAFLSDVDHWLLTTGSVWTHLARKAGVSVNIRNAVRQKGHGMLRVTQAAIAGEIVRNPRGLEKAVGSKQATEYLTLAETDALACEVRAWLERTGTPLWSIAVAAGRDKEGLARLLDRSALRASKSVATRYRQLMAENPDGMGATRERKTNTLPQPDTAPPPPTFDPLAERRGEAARMRKEWVAQQAAEHQRKYGRPLGRPIEEMAA